MEISSSDSKSCEDQCPVKLQSLVPLKVRSGGVGSTAEVGAILETACSHHPFLEVPLQSISLLVGSREGELGQANAAGSLQIVMDR